MSIAELFDNELKLKMKGRFSAVVRVLFADGIIDPKEKSFLDSLAIKLEISNEEYQEILSNPMKFELNPPYLHEERIENLYHLARVVHHDQHLGDREEIILQKLALSLGFSVANVNYIVNKALILIGKQVDSDTFILEIQNIHR